MSVICDEFFRNRGNLIINQLFITNLSKDLCLSKFRHSEKIKIKSVSDSQQIKLQHGGSNFVTKGAFAQERRKKKIRKLTWTCRAGTPNPKPPKIREPQKKSIANNCIFVEREQNTNIKCTRKRK